MKKHLSFLMIAFSILAFAQVPYSILLKNVDWRVMKINYNGTDYFTPSPFSLGSAKLQISGDDNVSFSASFFNATSGGLVFGANNANYFTVIGVASTLGVYYGENETNVQRFDGLSTSTFYHNQFSSTDKFYFEYEEVMSGKNLVITNPNGMKIYYSNMILATENNVKAKFSIYPNPTSDVLQLKNISTNSDIKIVDAQGKLVLKANNLQQKDFSVSVKHLTKGVYFLLVGNQTTQFIKN